MKKYILHLGQTSSGRNGFSLKSKRETEKKMQSPATHQDIKDLEKKLTWPPPFTRDINLQQMQHHKDSLDRVWDDPNLDPSTKLIRAGYHSQMFAIANKKCFKKGTPAERLLTNKAVGADERDFPVVPAPLDLSRKEVSPIKEDEAKASPRYRMRKRSSPASKIRYRQRQFLEDEEEDTEEKKRPKIRKSRKRTK